MAELNGVPADVDAIQPLALINYGHFTSMRIERGCVRGLSMHLGRLAHDCREFFDAELDCERARLLIRQAVADNPDGTFDLRVTVYDPDLPMGKPGNAAKPQILVTKREASPSEILPALHVKSALYSRESPLVKHVGLCGTMRLRRMAQVAGFDDVLFTGPDGLISEGATWNVGFFDGDNVVWPDAPVLEGVTMRLVQQAHPATRRRPISVSDVGSMRAAFATNVSIGVRPISAINEVDFDESHPIIDELRSKYLAVAPDAV